MIAAGIGSRKTATVLEILDAIQSAEDDAGISCLLVATLDRDGARDAILEAGQRRGCEVRLLSLGALASRSDECLTQSAAALARYGVRSVAEAAALAGAGAGSILVAPRVVRSRVTAAIAIAVDKAEPGNIP